MVRFVKEGDTGLYMRNKMLESMWIDVDKRSRKLGVISCLLRRSFMLILGIIKRLFLFSFDEEYGG